MTQLLSRFVGMSFMNKLILRMNRQGPPSAFELPLPECFAALAAIFCLRGKGGIRTHKQMSTDHSTHNRVMSGGFSR